MNRGEYVAQRMALQEEARKTAPVYIVKWKKDGKYLTSDRLNEWSTSRGLAFRFPTKTNADMSRRAIGATDLYARTVKLVRKEGT